MPTKHDRDQDQQPEVEHVPDEARPIRTELPEGKAEELNPAEKRHVTSHTEPPTGPDTEVAGTDPGGWPAHTFDAKGQVGAPGERPVSPGMPPVPPEPGGRDPAVEELLRTGVEPEQDHPTMPGDPPGRADLAARRDAEAKNRRSQIPPAPGNDEGEE